MSYIDLINAFERWLETNYLPSTAQLLWYKLLVLFNKAGWCEWVTVDNRRLMSIMQIDSEKTLIRNRDILIENGFIEYQKGKKGSPNRYKICTVIFTGETTGKMTGKTTVNTAVKTTVNTSNINNINNIKQKKKENIKKKENTPPTLEEVQAYCRERNNGVDAKKFYDYYTSANWKDNTGKPVLNWKQKMIAVWEKKEDKKQVKWELVE